MNNFQNTQVGMLKSRISKLKIALVSILLIFGLAVSPAQADHYRHVIAPLATVAALAYLFNNGDSHATIKRRSYRSHGYNNNGQRHAHRNYSHRKHSHSSGGYSHKSKNRHQH
jgi:type IV secretory pathway TrbL component